MTIQEMHIAVNLGVQKISSFQVDNLLPQEIDHELNVAMEKFIKQRYNPNGNKYREGFEQSQKRIDDLRNLVVTSKVDAYYNRESIESGEFFVERARLPQDYMTLINMLTNVRFNCAGAVDPVLAARTKIYFSVSLTPPFAGYKLKAIKYYDPANPSNIGGAFIENENGLEPNDYSNAANYTLGIIPVVSEQDQGVNDDYELTPTVDSNRLLLNAPDATYVQNGWVAVWVNPLTDEEVVIEYPGPPITRTLVRRDDPNFPTKRVPGKFVQQDDIHAILYDPFNTTKHKYPKYTIQENFIDIYSNTSFIPIFVELTYIRRPKKLDYINGVGCELPEHTHQEIVEMAVKSILETIESPRYQTQSMENMESE